MKFKKETSDEVTSILAEGTEMTGEITFSQGLRVDGLVRGQIRSAACLDIGPDGRVEADVRIRRVSVSGELRGVIHASGRVEIHKERRVYGDIFTPCLIIEAGALFEGRCNMSEKDSEAASAASPPIKPGWMLWQGMGRRTMPVSRQAKMSRRGGRLFLFSID